MEKILFVTDAVKLNMQHLDFACSLANLTSSRLIGVFLENLEYELRSKEILQQLALNATVADDSIRNVKEGYCKEHINVFKEACEVRGVKCHVHRDRGVPAAEVISESRYADLIVIDPAISFGDQRENIPTGFVREVLKDAECPVVIAPDTFECIDRIIFSFDHSRSAVFAIKEFTHLFPGMRDRKAVILSVTTPGDTAMEDKYKLKEWLKTHYEDIDLVVLEDKNLRAGLLEYLLAQKNAFIVMGAFGRGPLSNFFAPSHATPVVRAVSQPVFITHC
jgi:nucleotide-binding universal stress UspA family protein